MKPFYKRIMFWMSLVLIVVGVESYRAMPKPWFLMAWVVIWLGVYVKVFDESEAV